MILASVTPDNDRPQSQMILNNALEQRTIRLSGDGLTGCRANGRVLSVTPKSTCVVVMEDFTSWMMFLLPNQ